MVKARSSKPVEVAQVVRCHMCATKKLRTPQGLWNDERQWFCGPSCVKKWDQSDVGLTTHRY